MFWNIELEEVRFWNDVDYILYVLNFIRGYIYICFNFLWNLGCEFIFFFEKVIFNVIIFVYIGISINRLI